MSKISFCRLIHKKKDEAYDCAIISENAKEWVTICAGPNDTSEIGKSTFSKKEFMLEPRSKAQVESWFLTSLIISEKKKLDAEFEVKFAEQNLKRRIIMFEEVFVNEG